MKLQGQGCTRLWQKEILTPGPLPKASKHLPTHGTFAICSYRPLSSGRWGQEREQI